MAKQSTVEVSGLILYMTGPVDTIAWAGILNVMEDKEAFHCDLKFKEDCDVAILTFTGNDKDVALATTFWMNKILKYERRKQDQGLAIYRKENRET